MELQIWHRRGLLIAVGCLAFVIIGSTLYSSYQWINKPFPGFFLYGNLTVAPNFLPQWSGKREGLRFLDRVVAFQGDSITHPEEIYDLVRRYPPGSKFQYAIKRQETAFQVIIPSMKFSFYDWLLGFGIYLITGLGFLIIGAAPFYFRSTAEATVPLFFMGSAIFLWFASTFDFMTVQVLPREVRIFCFILTPSAVIHLGLLLSRDRRERKGHIIYLFLAYGISILLGAFYSLTFFEPLELWSWVLRLAYAYSCLAALIFLALLWDALRRPTSNLERSRLRIIFVGALLGFFLPTTGAILTSVFLWDIPYNLIIIPTVFFPISVAYALLKYQLFNLELALKAGLSRVALTGVLLLIYVVVVSGLGIPMGIYENDILIPIFFSVLVVLIFNPLLRLIEGVLDQYFYRKEYDPIQLQDDVSGVLRTLSKPRSLVKNYLELISDCIQIENSNLYFWSRDEDRYVAVSSNGDCPDFDEPTRKLAFRCVEHFRSIKRGISMEEAKGNPHYQGHRNDLLMIFNEFEAEILIPIIFEEVIIGILSFGKKRSGRVYSVDDFRLLCSLADQLSLALQNGMLYERSEKDKEKYQLLYDESKIINKKLIDMNKQKRDFVANISHELRTPISTILGYTEVLQDHGFNGDIQVILDRVVINSQELSQVMDNLLNFSRMEIESISTNIKVVKIKEIFQLMDLMVRRLIKGRPIQFKLPEEPSLEFVETDLEKVHQILAHLLTNAVKFTEKGEISLEIRPRLENGDSFAEFSVSDTGIGVNQDDQDIIFEEFRQLDGTSTRQYGGTGLGLNLCQKLAQALGGRIEVDSKVGVGSTFSLILPLNRLQREIVNEKGLDAVPLKLNH